MHLVVRHALQESLQEQTGRPPAVTAITEHIVRAQCLAALRVRLDSTRTATVHLNVRCVLQGSIQTQLEP